MRVHVPRDQQGAVAEFLTRLRGFFKEKWGVDVPEMVFNTSATNAPVVDAGEAGKIEEKTAGKDAVEEVLGGVEKVIQEKEEQGEEGGKAEPSSEEVKAEQMDPNNNNQAMHQEQQQKPAAAEGVAADESAEPVDTTKE